LRKLTAAADHGRSQYEAIASSCFRQRQIFAHLFHDKGNVNFN